MKVRKGDQVQVLTGKYRGEQGKVVRVLPAKGKLVVEGVNVVKRHTKPRQANAPGGIIEKELPIDVSNVAVLSPKDGKPTRVGYRLGDDGTKVRVCKRTGDVI